MQVIIKNNLPHKNNNNPPLLLVKLISHLSNNKQSLSPDYSGCIQIKEKTIIKAKFYQRW